MKIVDSLWMAAFFYGSCLPCKKPCRFNRYFSEDDYKMRDWLIYQIEHFNVLMILVMIVFVSALSRANLQKQLKAQNEEVYKEFEEIKDEIRGIGGNRFR